MAIYFFKCESKKKKGLRNEFLRFSNENCFFNLFYENFVRHDTLKMFYSFFFLKFLEIYISKLYQFEYLKPKSEVSRVCKICQNQVLVFRVAVWQSCL